MTKLTRRHFLATTTAAVALPALHGRAFAAPSVGGPVSIDVFALASSNWQLVIDRFTAAHPNVKVNFTKFGTDDFKQALRVGAASGKLPDVWWNWGGSLASPYNRAGHALKITPEILRARPETY